ncbi:ATP-binding protein [Candidatus Woesearchaeota archaeon]|mgnify:FL=1|jgi:hypothetical protein|nr:ATP-binding protein [Candidatus Woesearchaeota archaeon]MBT7555795.1 ATP-binding protein [Candidatus Woesearchaeota archaeon]
MENLRAELFKSFVDSLLDVHNIKNVLVVDHPNKTPTGREPFGILSTKYFPKTIQTTEKFFLDLDYNEGTFDLILGNVPMGLRNSPSVQENFPKNKENWGIIFRLSQNLTNTGLGIFLLEPLGFNGRKGSDVVDFMKSEGIHVNGYLNLPDKFLEPNTPLKPIFVITSKQDLGFQLGDIGQPENVETVVKEFFGQNEDKKLVFSYDIKSFRGFKSINIKNQISRLETRYKDFKETRFESVVEQFVLGKSNTPFEDLENSVYFKRLGSNSLLKVNLSELTGRVDNYIQVQLSPDISNKYLQIFFQSTLGELILDYVMNSMFIPRLDREILFSLDLPIPSRSIQDQIVLTSERYELLENEIHTMKKQISLNPQSISTLEKIDSMLEISSSLSEGDKIKSLILQGESKNLEFKQTFQHCIKSKKKEKYIEESCLKTIVGFLNTEGGVLLIGVEDSGLIPGINSERKIHHKDSNDKFILHMKDKIKSRIGMFFDSKEQKSVIDIRWIEIDDVTVLEVTCLPSEEEVFLDNEKFYIRLSPSTEILTGKNLSSYVIKRFYKL